MELMIYFIVLVKLTMRSALVNSQDNVKDLSEMQTIGTCETLYHPHKNKQGGVGGKTQKRMPFVTKMASENIKIKTHHFK